MNEPEIEGRVIDDRYRLIRKVGHGGMGEVYEAEQLSTGKRVAIKLLHGERAGDPTVQARLEREAETTSRIEHQNVVRIEDFGHDADGSLYMAMEWLDGETLEDRLERDTLALDETVAIVHQICAGLEAAHDIDLIHRDLKPANVFLVRGGEELRVVLVDFGIAKLIGDDARSALTEQGTFVGTPYYVPPEQALGDPVDRRADVYSLGAMLYEMIAGRPPYEASSVMGVLQQHIEARPKPPSSFVDPNAAAPGLDAVVLRCLSKRPEDRFASAAAVAEALERVRRDPASQTLAERISLRDRTRITGPSSSRSMVRAIRGNPARRVLAIALVIAVFGGAGFGAWALLRNSADDDGPRLPAPAATSWQHSATTEEFSYAATVTPSPSRPGHPITLTVRVTAVKAGLRDDLKAGRLSAAIEVRDSLNNTMAITERSIGPRGRFARPVTATPQAGGAHRVQVRLIRRGKRIGLGDFRFCVGADPLGDPEVLRRMCPGFDATNR